VYAFLAEFYEGWSPVFLNLFKVCQQFTPGPLDYFPADQQWESQANLTIIGDAAHLMPPSGEGVNTAMLDALDLSECLTGGKHADLKTALADFETSMRERAAILLDESLKGLKDLVSPDEESIRRFLQMFDQEAG